MAIAIRETEVDYEHSWRDLRRRELAFWAVVFSYLPSVGLTMLAVSLFHYDVPKDFAVWVGGGWIAMYIITSLYRRGFRCPTVSQFLFSSGRR